MKTELLKFEDRTVRMILKDGEPWWVAKDVCDILGHTNSRMALDRLDADEKGVSRTYTPGGAQDLAVVNEPGLYALVMGSRKPEAKTLCAKAVEVAKTCGGYDTARGLHWRGGAICMSLGLFGVRNRLSPKFRETLCPP